MRIKFDTWHGPIFLETNKGITSLARFVFSRSHCHSLAVAIHGETSWPLMAIGKNIKNEPLHIVVKTPSDNLLDVFGLYSFVPQQVHTESIFQIRSYNTYKPLAIAAARPFAQILLHETFGTVFASN